jgi:hypothetical protein
MRRWFGGDEVEVGQRLLKGASSRMAEALVPQIDRRRSGDKSLGGRRHQRVQLTRAVTSEDLRPSRKILDRKTKWIKFNNDVIISSKGSNKDEILDEGGRNKNIVEKQW